jgi:hypothetical protein
MTISEGELLILNGLTPNMGWDSRAVGTRRRWVTDGLHRREVIDDAEEQFIRDKILRDQPGWGTPLPGAPGTSEESKAWNYQLLLRIPLAT